MYSEKDYRKLLKKILLRINGIGIKYKLIILFIFIKIIPIIIVAFIAFRGAILLENKLMPNTEQTFQESQDTLKKYSTIAIQESMSTLDSEYQENIEQIGSEIGKKIANFLYQRDQDLLLLSSLPVSNKTLQDFARFKTAPILIPNKYNYDSSLGIWSTKSLLEVKKKSKSARLKQNSKYFKHKAPISLEYQNIPIYKELTFFDLKGKEKFKHSDLNSKLLDIRLKNNTFIRSESYFKEIQNLKKGDIFVSELVGTYVGSRVRGIYNQQNVAEIKGQFLPENSAFAGIENPNGKKFKGIIRFITPYFQKGKKIGYITLALDHRHIQEFTDYVSPISETVRDIPNSASANYCYLWDEKGLIIAHPKNYYIMGFNPKTGTRVAPWMHQKLFESWKTSKIKDAYTFLKSVPQWDKPDEYRPPSAEQARDSAQMGLDMRYSKEIMWNGYGLFQLTNDGGSGSYQYFWDNKWKLMTASPIPYYTGRYKNSPRGFGIVCLGADVNNFHKAANETQNILQEIISRGESLMHSSLNKSRLYLNVFFQ